MSQLLSALAGLVSLVSAALAFIRARFIAKAERDAMRAASAEDDLNVIDKAMGARRAVRERNASSGLHDHPDKFRRD